MDAELEEPIHTKEMQKGRLLPFNQACAWSMCAVLCESEKMSSPYWIIKLDAKVKELRDRGVPPKQIVILLSLTNVHVVYRSLARLKCSTQNQNAKERKSNPMQK